jgi:hypothetical protein
MIVLWFLLGVEENTVDDMCLCMFLDDVDYIVE